jgi:pyruvate formate lyase activating enzyme
VFDIQRFCTQDGPGIRTTVFFKGCNLRCKWCHNPESFDKDPQLGYLDVKCKKCAACAAVCPHNVHHISADGVHTVDYKICTACGKCAEVCTSEALKIYGISRLAETITEEIKKDKNYSERSGGGVTFSGGEPTLQIEFLMELLRRCKEEHIHTAVETNGVLSKKTLERLCEYTDLFLVDFKISKGEEQKYWLGIEKIDISAALSFLLKENKPVVLRCPVIPGINDSNKHFAEIKKLEDIYKNIYMTEIMPYHDTAKGKWKSIGLEYQLPCLKTVPPEQKAAWERLIER